MKSHSICIKQLLMLELAFTDLWLKKKICCANLIVMVGGDDGI